MYRTVQYGTGTGDFFFPYSLFNHFFFYLFLFYSTVHTVYCVYSTFFSIRCSNGMNLIFFILVYVRTVIVHSFQFLIFFIYLVLCECTVPYSTVPVPVISFFHIHCSIIYFFICCCCTVHTVYCVYSTFFSNHCSTGMNLIFFILVYVRITLHSTFFSILDFFYLFSFV